MRTHLLALIIALLLAATCACAPLVVVGAGAGAGAFTYVKGELECTYPANYNKAIAVSESVSRQLKITIDSKVDDGITTTLKGRRPDDTPVTIKVTMLDPKISKIGVRVGMVGLWDRNVSQVIHNHIEKQI